MVRKGRIAIGIICFVAATYLWFEVDSEPTRFKQTVELCNAGWGDILGSWGERQCLKVQAYYYSPWILGIIGVIFFAKSRSDYYGSRNPRYY